MQPKPRRPTGVTILGVLAILGGIALLVAGVAAIGLGLVNGTYAGSAFTNALSNAGYSGLASIGAGTIAVILLALGAVVLCSGNIVLRCRNRILWRQGLGLDRWNHRYCHQHSP